MAGPVQKQARIASGVLVFLKWSKYITQTKIAPTNAPNICAAIKLGTLAQANFPAMASPMVTAGFKCAPLYGPATTTPTNTASPQPVVKTNQPALLPLVSFNKTLATTPLPSSMSNMVPISSAINGDILFGFYF